MKSRIISLGLVASLVCLLPQVAEAQIAASNPLEWTALAEGNELINGQIEKQIKGQTQTALLQNSIATEFNQIHKWEKQYNSYLKTASGYPPSGAPRDPPQRHPLRGLRPAVAGTRPRPCRRASGPAH